MGDPTDGVPGVSKIGMKTAARLLNAYGDLDAVMAGAGILKTRWASACAPSARSWRFRASWCS
jgi:5'-3' exonuclease